MIQLHDTIQEKFLQDPSNSRKITLANDRLQKLQKRFALATILIPYQYSDQSGDIHSPHIYKGQKFAQLRGLWHAHIGWMLNSEVTNSALFAKDLLQDRAITKVNKSNLRKGGESYK